MFNLEKSIAEWRQQMLAAGIKTPVPLEELENHLREAVDQQIRSGKNAPEAFEVSLQQMGRAEELRAEFKKAGGPAGWRSQNKQARLNRVLASLWLALCSWNFFGLSGKAAMTPHFEPLWILFLVIFFWGIVASIRLFAGNQKEARALRAVAIFGAVAFAISAFEDSMFMAVFALFSAVSIWLLRSPVSKNSAQT